MTSKELKKWREDNGYTQAKLAKALDVAVMTVSRWETDLRSIPSFLHLALRCLELEGGEQVKGKTRKERRPKK
jgi:transcriptional regulator with XRE-family HTH domain